MQNEYAILYLEINIVALVLVSIILHKTAGLSKMVAQRNFVLSAGMELLFFTFDTISVLTNEHFFHFDFGFVNDDFVRFTCKSLYFFSSAWMGFFWFIYFELVRGSAFFGKKSNRRLASLPLWFMGVLLIFNIFYGFLFYIDESGVYRRGPFFWVAYLFSYIYIAVACGRTILALFKKSYRGDRQTLILHTLFPLGPGLAGIIQFFYPRLPVACVTMSLTTLLFYMLWTDQLISLDPLTGLNNRKQLLHYYDHWSKNHGSGELMYILMIDANKFKSINDNYGHIMGDQALKNIAEALRVACKLLPKRGNIARYGGDEFAVLFESNDPSLAILVRKKINEALKAVNERTGLPFELTASTGISFTDGSLTLKELIDKADEDMYAEKSAYSR